MFIEDLRQNRLLRYPDLDNAVLTSVPEELGTVSIGDVTEIMAQIILQMKREKDLIEQGIYLGNIICQLPESLASLAIEN